MLYYICYTVTNIEEKDTQETAMRYVKYIFALMLLLCMVICASACSREKEADKNSPETEGTTQSDETEEMDDITLEGMAQDVLDQMTLEEKIGQLFIVCTDSLDFSAETAVTEEMKENLDRYQPGGVIFYSFNIDNREQVTTFIRDMQEQVKIPLFIAVDEEGGKVARIANNEKMGTTSFPTMKEIGDSGAVSQAIVLGETIGREISALGFNLDFAPVADVMSKEANTEIGERSFGSDPELVADMCVEVVKGLQKNNVCATLKHFPGQGSSEEDTHKGFADMDVTIEQLRKSDFIPFQKGIEAGVDLIMTSHVAMSEVTGNDLPSSLSSIVVHDILREELRYENLIITDAMNMKSITKFYDADEAAVMALQAGNDMILMPDDFTLAVSGIQDAVDQGQITEEQIDDSVIRILKTKIKRGIISRDSDYFKE